MNGAMDKNIDNKESFLSLCLEFGREEESGRLKSISGNFKKLIGHGVDNLGVFQNPESIEIINAKGFSVVVTYIKTPLGYLTGFGYRFKGGPGYFLPATVNDAKYNRYTDDLRERTRNEVAKLLEVADKRSFSQSHQDLLAKYLEQTEQIGMFETELIPVLDLNS